MKDRSAPSAARATEDERLARCAAQREIARARSKAYYEANREVCAKKAYIRALSRIKKPKPATLRLYGLDDAPLRV